MEPALANTNTGTKSNLTLTGRSNLSITGIKKVKSTEPARVIAVLDNCSIIIAGTNLSVQNISLTGGTLELTGIINSITYGSTAKRKFSLKNIFK